MPWIRIIAPEAYVKKTFDIFQNRWVSYYNIKIKSKSESRYWKDPKYTLVEMDFRINPMDMEEWKAFFKNVLGFEALNVDETGEGDYDLAHYVTGGISITNDNPWLLLSLLEKDIIHET